MTTPVSADASATLKKSSAARERSQIVQIARVGLIEFGRAIDWQAQRGEAVASGAKSEIVLLLEHPPCYTQGRRGGREHVLRPLSAPIIDTDRGGDVTFHGPGQLVVWPILRLRERGIGIASYIRALEAVAIDTAHEFGVEAQRFSGRPGVWIGNRKLASVGVRLQAGVSRHGLAINCDTDLSWFDDIHACGFADARAASLSQEAGHRVTVEQCAAALERHFARRFGLRLSPVRLTELAL